MGYRRKVKDALHRRVRVRKNYGIVYSDCLKKAPYSTYRQAERVAERIKQERGDILRIYSCNICGMYHLTKQGAKHVTNIDKSTRYQ